jgi:hypothetical protein
MENFIEVKENIIKQAIEKNACESELERAKGCESWDELKVAIADNFWWCIDNDIELPDGHYKSSKCEFTIVNGKVSGEFKQWFDNSQLAFSYTYKEGFLHGEIKEWYEDGQLWEHSFYKDGKLEGEFKLWDEDDELQKHHIYKDGEIIEIII